MLGQGLARADPRLKMRAAQAYRSLGLVGRATAVATAVYAAATTSDMKYDAAGLLALLSMERDERERWLRLADPRSPFVRANLQSVEAECL